MVWNHTHQSHDLAQHLNLVSVETRVEQEIKFVAKEKRSYGYLLSTLHSQVCSEHTGNWYCPIEVDHPEAMM